MKSRKMKTKEDIFILGYTIHEEKNLHGRGVGHWEEAKIIALLEHLRLTPGFFNRSRLDTAGSPSLSSSLFPFSRASTRSSSGMSVHLHSQHSSLPPPFIPSTTKSQTLTSHSTQPDPRAREKVLRPPRPLHRLPPHSPPPQALQPQPHQPNTEASPQPYTHRRARLHPL